MDVENITDAYYIYQQMNELKKQKYIISGGSGLGVTIQSTYQDDSFVEAMRPYVLAELERRIDEKKLFLEELGVSFE
ncbi:hypothetical protein [Klebsiella oxytoca]|uniref:hypothetical protein n=1 Tax=Klebsiella oxytoca TaxID=571 RepID=UPI000B9F9DED|nr:hypothetical protein [Klebsiella oxytoca]MRG07059.1 hypothetical protein [Klebsiella oxytoca]MRG42649.1 hypothetical protein [Klebsiella oxytoca]OZS15746.1 hypothetical protein CIG58_27715 [Klebsiella oxytoca]